MVSDEPSPSLCVCGPSGTMGLTCFRVESVDIDEEGIVGTGRKLPSSGLWLLSKKQDTHVGNGSGFEERSPVLLPLFSLRLTLRSITATSGLKCVLVTGAVEGRGGARSLRVHR